jgi:hypothetical protein
MKHDLNKTLASMDPKSVIQVLDGISAIPGWFGGTYMGKGGKGKLLVSAPAPSITLLANTMKWLSTYFWPETTKGHKKVFRLHTAKNITPVVGKAVKIKPFKPLLSWTTIKNPSVKGRGHSADDCVLSLENPKVLFTIQTLHALAKYKIKIPSGVSYDLKKLQQRLDSAVKQFSFEKEVVVWHGTAPFEATVYTVGSKAAAASVADQVSTALNVKLQQGAPNRWSTKTPIPAAKLKAVRLTLTELFGDPTSKGSPGREWFIWTIPGKTKHSASSQVSIVRTGTSFLVGVKT